MSDTKFTSIPLWHASPLHISTWSILIECASKRHKTSVFRFLEAWRNMEHLPQKLHLSIHNYAVSGVIHNLSLSHFSQVNECTCKWVFWQNVRCLIQNIMTSEPQLQFQWKKLQNVALVASFNLHSFSSINSLKREIYGHFSGEHLFKKIAIFESTMKRTSAVHTYLNCTYSHGGYKLWI